MHHDLYGRNFVKELDLTPDDFTSLLDLAAELKVEKAEGGEQHRLTGRNIALIFEKTSTRTRCAFEVAAHDQGAHVTYLGPGDSQLGRKESIEDTACVLGRMFDGIEYRGFGQERVEALARFAGVPVWNGLTDEWHPTQMLADMLTMREHSTRPLTQVAFCYLGDARNNTARSLLVTGAMLGMDVRLAAPQSLWPDDHLRAQVDRIAAETGARIAVTVDPQAAVEGVDFIYTDTWVSMGEPATAWGERVKILLPYQVNANLISVTGNPDVCFMHCLPAMHDRQTEVGEAEYELTGLGALEVTDEVFESRHSIVFDQAENRLHTIKALLVATLAS
jgi:ornithine carbamoyltransferase